MNQPAQELHLGRRGPRRHERPLGAAALEQPYEPSRLAAVDHPRLDARRAQRRRQVLVDSRGSPRRAELGELAHAQATERLAIPRPVAVEAGDRLDEPTRRSSRP